MFRDGHYLEVIKASKNCLATAIITVQERTIDIKNRKVSTNKWLDAEDWAAVYKVLEKAILKNAGRKDYKKSPARKFTRRLEVSYTFEDAECPRDVSSLPTIRANVSWAKRKSDKSDTSARKDDSPDKKSDSRSLEIEKSSRVVECEDSSESWSSKNLVYQPTSRPLENGNLEEYVPDGPPAKRHCASGLKYVPSRKSALERNQQRSNEYTPTFPDNKHPDQLIRYVPSSVTGSNRHFEAYEPSAVGLPEPAAVYVPNSKGTVEEYQPDFTSDKMKFDDSYVPSSVRVVDENIRKSGRQECSQGQASRKERKEARNKRKGLFSS